MYKRLLQKLEYITKQGKNRTLGIFKMMPTWNIGRDSWRAAKLSKSIVWCEEKTGQLSLSHCTDSY